MTQRFERPWGHYEILELGAKHWVKRLVIGPGHRLSLQSHELREEVWLCIQGEGEALVKHFPVTLKNGSKYRLAPSLTIHIPQGAIHRLTNTGRQELIIIEAAFGRCFEGDITRYEDDYDRH